MNNLNHSPTLAPRFFAAAILLALAGIPGSALADVRYVDVNSTNSTPPYTSWAAAATNIQDAVDAAVAGDEIVVTNGIYASGGRPAVGDSTTNRVAVDKPVTLRSVNGPQSTTIEGGQSVRCVYLTNGASLSGFTLTNGVLQCADGAGALCASTNVVVSNCVVAGNRAYGGDCCAALGAGVHGGTLNNCTLTGNSGDGAWSSTLNNCTLTGNSGRGAVDCTLNNCTLTGNSGGGAGYSTLNNCTLTGNSAADLGGGAVGCTLNNCTLTGNSASYGGGGANYCTLNNCIAYFNTSTNGANYDSSSTLNYSCTTPQPTNGVGNIPLDPQLASFSHLSAASPCRGAGNAAYASSTDIDGEAWANPPSIGCDEYHAGAVTGPLSVGIAASFTYVRMGFTVQLTALIEGRTSASSWDFGDGTAATNHPYASHAWTALGDYAVVLRAFNESQPGGISATVTVHVVAQPTHYVSATSTNPVAPFASWTTAATNIQDAVDAAVPGAVVLVTNGIYATSGRATVGDYPKNWENRVAVDKPLSLRSVNGPQFTAIDGGKSNRCVYLTNGASLSGITLTNGFAHYGGGLWCESTNALVSNCVLSGNSTFGLVVCGFDCFISPAFGGGVAGGTLNNCILSDNRAEDYYVPLFQYRSSSGGGAGNATLNNCTLTGNSADYGGGADYCTLNNCTLSGNSADYGGGVSQCTLNNCIIYFNTSTNGANNNFYSTLNYGCTTPQPTNGVGNITNAPLFVDLAGGNLRLQPQLAMHQLRQ